VRGCLCRADGAALDAKARGRAVACTTLQWHAAAVGAITFSSDGNYLLSGGVEAVLVLWSLVSGGTAAKQFLPRLGAPICQLGRVSRWRV
jgi:NET1-associated nuclear protein 1 (U3 small nucleolar RNA-associated protein 17)